MLVSWSGSGGWWVRTFVAKNNNYGFETQSSKSGDDLYLRANKLLLKKKKICRQNFIWLLNIPLYLPRPFIFLPSWHSQVQGQQWALITFKSYNCVVLIFEYLTLNHTPLSTMNQSTIFYGKRYNCVYFQLQRIKLRVLLNLSNQTVFKEKGTKWLCLKIIILTFNFRYDEMFSLCFQSFRRTRFNLNFPGRMSSFTPPRYHMTLNY